MVVLDGRLAALTTDEDAVVVTALIDLLLCIGAVIVKSVLAARPIRVELIEKAFHNAWLEVDYSVRSASTADIAIFFLF